MILDIYDIQWEEGVKSDLKSIIESSDGIDYSLAYYFINIISPALDSWTS